MTRYRLTIALLALSLGACIKHGRYRPQTGSHPVYSLSMGQRLATASMLRPILDSLPDNHAVACLDFTKPEHGYNYLYRPDTVLLRMLRGRREVVGTAECPPTRIGFHADVPAAGRLPAGYVDPYHVTIASQQYAPTQAAANIAVYQHGVRWTNRCTTRRISHNSWVGTCRGMTIEILGATNILLHLELSGRLPMHSSTDVAMAHRALSTAWNPSQIS